MKDFTAMKIISEQWTSQGHTMIEAGYHINPPKYVVRVRTEGRKPQTIEVETREQLAALAAAVTALHLDERTPNEFTPGFEDLRPGLSPHVTNGGEQG